MRDGTLAEARSARMVAIISELRNRLAAAQIAVELLGARGTPDAAPEPLDRILERQLDALAGLLDAIAESPLTERPSVSHSPRSAQARIAPGSGADGRRVLVAEDNEDLLVLLRLVLEDSGFEVLGVADGDEALTVARRERPPLFVVDLDLPGVHGYEVMRTLRRELPDAFVVAISGYGTERHVRGSYEAGADHHLVKPFDPRELTTLLDAASSRRA